MTARMDNPFSPSLVFLYVSMGSGQFSWMASSKHVADFKGDGGMDRV